MRAIRVLVALLFAAYNVVPLYGLWAWHWDAFQLLILYWSETVVLAAWTMVRLAFVPPNLLGDVTINGRTVPATHTSLIGIMSLVAGIFCLVHLVFLCVIFSGDWFRRLHGLGDFLRTFYIASDAWIPLGIVTLAGGAEADRAIPPAIRGRAGAAPEYRCGPCRTRRGPGRRGRQYHRPAHDPHRRHAGRHHLRRMVREFCRLAGAARDPGRA